MYVCVCDSLSTQFWAMIISIGCMMIVHVSVFFSGAMWETKELGCTNKIQSTKGQSDSLKDGLLSLLTLSSSSSKLLTAIVDECVCFFRFGLHILLFMQLLTTLMATKQLHFNPFRNHFGRLTNDDFTHSLALCLSHSVINIWLVG